MSIKTKRIETVDGHCIIMDKYITVYTRCFPKGKLFKIKMFIKGRLFLVDDNNKMWIYYLIPKLKKVCNICEYMKRKFIVYCEKTFYTTYLENICKNWTLKRKSLLSFSCQPYCSKKVKRIHLSCFWCRNRRIIQVYRWIINEKI